MRFFRDSRGAISVFQCIVFTALLILTGAIVDMARIAVAERKVQSVLNTSLRSVLADYNADMAGDYGIFGLDTRSAENTVYHDYMKYLEENILEKHAGFNFINYQINSDGNKTFLEGAGNLLAHNNLRNQILQYMKYRAPLAVSKNIIEKFMMSGLSRKTKFAESEKKARMKWKVLVSQLEGINRLVTEAQGAFANSLTDLENLRSILQAALEKNRHVGRLLNEYYDEKAKSDEVAQETQQTEIKAEGSEISSVRQDFDNLLNVSIELDEKISVNIAGLDNAIKKIEEMQAQAKSLKNEHDSIESMISELKKEVGKKESESQKRGVQNHIHDLELKLYEINSQINSLINRINQVLSDFHLEEMRRFSVEQDRKYEASYDDAAKERADDYMNALRTKLSSYLTDIDPKWLIENTEFEEAKLADESSGFAEEAVNFDGISDQIEAEIKNDNVLKYMRNLFDAFADIMQNGAEKIYITEYIMDRHTYATSKTKRPHYLEKGEVEYILWGDNSQVANIAKTMGSIWFLRFAVDTIDKFAVSPNPEPVSRLIGALLEGFALSCNDIIELYKGKEISICPSLKKAVKVNYADHLRILLLLSLATESGERARLKNVMQLMQVNMKKIDSSFELGNYNTIVHGKVEVSIDLWFLPVLQLDKLNLKHFKGGRYVMQKEIYIGY